MQPPIEPCRSQLTAAQVTYLLRDAPSVQLTGGLELVDLGLNVILDISDDLAGGSVSRNSYADLHASASLQISRDLAWGSALVRPYIVVGSGALSARFNLGVYHTNTPVNDATESPTTFDVEATDILFRLDQPVGESYAVDTGSPYLQKVEDILVSLGFTAFIIDQTAAATLTPTERVWPLADNPTWLNVVNDLLASIGYAGVWSDWNGALRLERYVLPQDRAIEWYYDDGLTTSMIEPERSVTFDYFAAPNKWVFYRTNDTDGPAPVEGDGVFTYINQSIGLTSIDQRGGLVITKPVGLDAADQSSLVAQGMQTVQTDMDIPTVVNAKTFPNPLHWHFDRLYVQDSRALPAADVQCTEWSLPLPPDSGSMTQVWRVISQ